MNKQKDEEDTFAKAFQTQGFRRSWVRYERIVDEFPFDEPMDAVAWKKELRRNKYLRYALLDNMTAGFKKSFKTRFRPQRNYIISVYGPPGTGKSVFNAMLIWNGIQICPTGSYAIAATYDEIISAIISLPPHSTISYDENLEPTGKGSRIILTHLENLMKMLRKYEINIIFNFKEEEHIPIAKYHLEMFGFNPATGETRALVLNWKHHYIGHIILKKEFPPEFYAPFELDKDDLMKTLKKDRGKISAFSEFDIYEAVERGKEVVRDSGVRLNSDKDIVEVLDMNETLEIPSNYLEKVARRIRILLEKEQPALFVQEATNISSERMPCVLLEEYRDLTFLPRILRHLEKRGVPGVKISVFALKCQNNTNLPISRKLGISTGSVSNYHNDILENDLGYAGEDARDDVLTEQGIKHKKGGYNTDAPDQIIYDPLMVESIKTYFVFRKSKASEEIGKKEVAFAQEHGCPLKLRAFECITQKFYVYRVVLEALNHHQSSSCESRNVPQGLNTPFPRTRRPRRNPPPGRVGVLKEHHQRSQNEGNGGEGDDKGIRAREKKPMPRLGRERRQQEETENSKGQGPGGKNHDPGARNAKSQKQKRKGSKKRKRRRKSR